MASGGEFQSCWKGIDISGAGIAGLLLSFVSVLFYATAMGTVHWGDGDSIRMGLFKYCEANVCQQYVDEEFLDQPSDLALVTRTQSTAAMCVLGMVISLYAIVTIVFSLGREGFGSSVASAGKALLLASFFGLIGMGIFADVFRRLQSDFENRGLHPGYSFGLEVTSWVLSFVAGILILVDSRNIGYLPASAAARHGGAGMI